MKKLSTGIRLLAVFSLLVFAATARADVTGGTTITNNVEVSYTDVAGSGTFTDTATISIEVVVIRSFEWANYSTGVDLDGGETVTEADGHTHLSVDFANNGNLSQSVTFTVNEDYRDLNDTGGLIWYFCNGDGTSNNDGAAVWPADDVSCSTTADGNSSTVFSHGVKEWPNASAFTANNDSVAVELWETPSDIQVGDVVMFDGDETELFKVTGVSGTTVTVQEDDPANTASTRLTDALVPGAMQEVVRLVAYGTAPNIPATGSVLDGSHESITWELEGATTTAGELTGFAWCTYTCTDDTAVVTGTTSTTETETGDPTLDDRTGAEIAVAILAPAIRIFKYVSASGAEAETADTDCVDRGYNGSGSGFFGDQDPGAGDGCLLENVDDDATITYLLRVMNGVGTLATTGDFAGTELASGGSSSFETTCITSNPPIAASTYDDQCVGTAKEVIVEDTYDTAYGRIVTSTAFIDEDCDGSQEDTDSTAPDNGKIWDNGTTLDFFPDNADLADETGDDDSTTPVGGTIYGGSEVCLGYEVQLATEAL